jgi:hypothetical protein
MSLTPDPRFDPIRKFEPTDTNHADNFNGVAQKLLNQSAWLRQKIDQIKASQIQIANAIASLAEYQTLSTQTVDLLTLVTNERSQNQTSDNSLTTIETGITTQNTAADLQIARIAAISAALSGIQIGTNYQAYSATLQAIALAAKANNTYLYSNNSGQISWSNPPNLGSGTRLRDCILKANVAAGAAAPALTSGAVTNAPLVQTFNSAASRVGWNSGTNTLTLAAGEYLVEGFFVARSPLAQMSLRGGISASGTTGKGTVDSAIVTATEPLAVYSHLLFSIASFSTLAINPSYYVANPGSILTNSMNLRSNWYTLRITAFYY